VDENTTILLADDTRLFLEIEKTFLQRTSVRILTAYDGMEALELARQHRPNVVILDLNMPEMDGAECCHAIKHDPTLHDTTVIMVTTGGRPRDQDRCRKAGCDEILLKPINRAEFLKRVEKYLRLPLRRKRYQAKFEVQYGEKGALSLTGYSIDISSGGLFIKTEKPLDVGESLALHFSLTNHEKEINCRANVAWVNAPEKPVKSDWPPGMGIQFVDISLGELHAIRHFIESNLLEPSW
jgi:uncharacterized protein (TIGR02266 family)